MFINKRVATLSQSTTLKITALTKKLKSEGKDVINFAAGEPDFDTPDFIKSEGKKAIDNGITKYTPSAGLIELREAIAKKLREENNISLEAKNVIVTAGAKYAIYSAILGVIEKGDEVIVPAPYWVSYPEMIKLAGGKTKIIYTSPKNGFKLTPDKLAKAIKPKTKLLILNYPANPTGVTYTQQELQAIYEVVQDKNVLVLSDEIYEKLLYDGRKHISFASLPGANKITFTVNGFSKAFSMTGWRMGYLAADEIFVKEISKIIDHTTSSPCSISQKAAIAALTNKEWPITMNKEFETRRNLLWEGLSQCKKINPLKPQGTFYMFCDIKKTGLSSLDFSSQLLEKHLVSIIPATDFGAEGFVRFSFAAALADISKGIERVQQFLARL